MVLRYRLGLISFIQGVKTRRLEFGIANLDRLIFSLVNRCFGKWCLEFSYFVENATKNG